MAEPAKTLPESESAGTVESSPPKVFLNDAQSQENIPFPNMATELFSPGPPESGAARAPDVASVAHSSDVPPTEAEEEAPAPSTPPQTNSAAPKRTGKSPTYFKLPGLNLANDSLRYK